MHNQEIFELMAHFDASTAARLKLTMGEFSRELEKAVAAPIPAAAGTAVSGAAAIPVAPAPVQEAEPEGLYITAPLVGTFYAAPAPGEPPFVSVGDTVKKGEVLFEINTDKTTMPVEATEDGMSDINYAPLGLGGFTYGVYMSELTAAYEIFGNGGYYNGFYCYDRVERDGTVLLQNEPLGVRAIEPDTSYVMNRLMQRVIRGPRGTLRQYASSWNGWVEFSSFG